ncbi:phosphomannomutase [Jiella sp. MQZ9-1]|uniref:Phosphomannomutase n=1 Tax=Jiella flava TaxID=2816857 RepID=A0A939FXI5_9HYPH|nr:phosphomannomutase [Jiella flava]MBO0661337.1 phosphomannomutase [Jiella flava]MCD2469982.1 phosphomannomutase [Jiella flava]
MTSLKFGTSGLRGLVTDLLGWPSYGYTLAFLRYLEEAGGIAPDARRVLVARDLRFSSPQIAAFVIAAARRAGFTPIDCGAVPTPAVALASLTRNVPAIMVTGSHIPEDRNGLKFYAPSGEIGKADEIGIVAAFDGLSEDDRADFDRHSASEGEAEALNAAAPFVARYTAFFGGEALTGLTVGVYQHSSVARDLLVEILQRLGAQTVVYGRADRFIPVDTEAHRPEDLTLLAEWAKDGRCDAFVSTDGDADRPLVADASGAVLRGDVIGLLTARHLGLSTIVTPVTSSAAIERSGIATTVRRTKVGSPYVIAGMAAAAGSGEAGIVGFEANGGLLLGSAIARQGRRLDALPTRDSVLPILAVLAAMAASKTPLATIVAGLDAGFTAAHRLKDVPASESGPFLQALGTDAGYRRDFFAAIGAVASVDQLDGVRVVLESGETLHYRASGNAPELRCYVEAAGANVAQRLLDWGLAAAEQALGR